jgi:rhodanese-related sulfurtransferase
MPTERTLAFTLAALLASPLAAQAPPRPTHGKLCLLCHQPAPATLRGNFDALAYQNGTFQIKVDDSTEVLRYDPKTIKVVAKEKAESPEAALKAIKKGHEVRIEYTEAAGVKTATLVAVKPPVEVAAAERLNLEDVQKLVALGPGKGKYFLFDSRPPVRFQEGNIPTAVNLPFPAFDANASKLPADKSALVIFYCSGKTCNMSPGSLAKAKKLGYTNVKVFVDGMPGWYSRNYGVIAPKSFKAVYPDKDMPVIVLDLRPAAEGALGFIKGAVTVADLAKVIKEQLPEPKAKAPILVVDEDGGASARAGAAQLVKAGYGGVNVLAGGMKAWQAEGLPVETGAAAAKVAYLPKPKPGSVPGAEFAKIAGLPPEQRGDVLILDVRTRKEAKEGMIKGALNLPQEELAARSGELPRDKRILIHCSTGLRAEMAYALLRDLGFKVAFLNAELTVIDTGEFTLD